MLRRILLFCIMMCFTCWSVDAQQAMCNCADSALYMQSEKLLELDKSDSAITVSQKLAKNKNPACKIAYHHLAATIAISDQDEKSAENELKKADIILSKLNCNSLKVAHYKLYCNMYNLTADYESVLDYNLKILSIAEELKNDYERANAMLNMSQIFNRLNNVEKAIEYTRKAVVLINTLPKKQLGGSLYNKAAATYIWYAQDKKNIIYLDTAEQFCKLATQVAEATGDNETHIKSLVRLNSISQQKGNMAAALNYLDKALLLSNPITNATTRGTIYGDKAYLLLKTGQYDKARYYADSGLYYHRRFNYPPLIANAYSLLYEIEIASGNYKGALEALQNERVITDSLTSSQKDKQVNELEQKYNKAQNELTIKELSQQKEIQVLQLKMLGIIVALAVIVIIMLVLIYRQRTYRQRQVQLETEQRLNRARINPHFFFNALTSLQGLAIKETDGRKLAMHLFSFSKLMRQILESTYDEYISIATEIEFLEEYLKLQKLRATGKFTYDISIDDSINPESNLLPAMILQPFVENSVEHGFRKIESGGHLDIVFREQEGKLIVTIADNGAGIENQNEKTHISRAMQITKDRLFLINRNNKMNATFIVKDNRPRGVLVEIQLPIITKK